MVYLWIVVIGAGAFVAIWWFAHMTENRRRQKNGYWVDFDDAECDLIYREGINSLSMAYEPIGIGYPAVLHVPTVEEWNMSMPDWAKGRRSDIMERITAELAKNHWRYDGYPP